MISILITGRGGSNLCNLSPKVPPLWSFFYTREKSNLIWSDYGWSCRPFRAAPEADCTQRIGRQSR
ncbi:hypothetical protein FOT80_02710 [Serratia fonticola]|nr:hypothetical protein [Serratia fonticola]